MSEDAFLASWSDLLRIVVVGALAYVGLVVILRVTGKRTLTKLNAFDLVVTVALGSTLASVVLSKDTALVEGLVAFATLILLQLVVTFATVRSPRFQALVKATPRLLAYRGTLIEAAMRDERVSREEILAVARSSGVDSVEAIGAVVLETDGSLSVMKAPPPLDDPRGTFATVRSTGVRPQA